MGAGNSAWTYSNVGVRLPKLSSTQKSGSLSTKLGVCGAEQQNIRFFGSKQEFYRQNFIVGKHMLLHERIFYEKYSTLIDYFVCNRQFALVIKNGSLLQKYQHPWEGLWC